MRGPPVVDHDGELRRLVRLGHDVELRWDGATLADDVLVEWRQECETVIERRRMMAQQRTPFGPHH